MKLSTIQKRNVLNKVERVGQVGPGGAYHDYKITYVKEPDLIETVGYISYQKGPRHLEDSRHGVTDQDLLEVVRDRLTCFSQGSLSNEDTVEALKHIEIALMYLNKRAEDRAERNVLGTYKK